MPQGCTMQHIPHPSREEEASPFLHRDNKLQVVTSEVTVFKPFEYTRRKIKSRSTSFFLAVLYWIPPSRRRKNSLTVPTFIEEFGRYIQSVLISSSKLLICGTFNFQMDNHFHPDTMKFLSLLNSTDPKHVDKSTRVVRYEILCLWENLNH